MLHLPKQFWVKVSFTTGKNKSKVQLKPTKALDKKRQLNPVKTNKTITKDRQKQPKLNRMRPFYISVTEHSFPVTIATGSRNIHKLIVIKFHQVIIPLQKLSSVFLIENFLIYLRSFHLQKGCLVLLHMCRKASPSCAGELCCFVRIKRCFAIEGGDKKES